MPLFIIFLLISNCATFDGSGNDIEELKVAVTNTASPGAQPSADDREMEFNELLEVPITIDTINNLLKTLTNDPFNVTFQLEFVRAVEAVNRGRLELTVWAHEIWTFPALANSSRLGHSTKLALKSRSELEFSSGTVFKNALYFKEHWTPSLNTVLQLTTNGQIALHSLYTLDIPCTKIVPTKFNCISYNLCGIDIHEDQHHGSVDAVCELSYGSLIRDNNQMRLSWAISNSVELNLPCSVEFVPRCFIARVRSSKKEITFLGDKYDELVACIVLSFPTKDSVKF